MTREENAEVFNDTLSLTKSNPVLGKAVHESTEHQFLLKENDDYTPHSEKTFPDKCRVEVSKRRTLEAAERYRGMKTAVLNFASAVNPGGGVRKGSSAQEESLCRISTLYPSLRDDYMWRNFYLPHRKAADRRNNDDLIYTPGVVVFKSDDDYMSLLRSDRWYSVNVITAAAPDLREPRPGDSDYGRPYMKITENELVSLHIKRMRRILSVAAGEGNEIVVLGAFGCGAFRNPPYIVAEAISDVIREYRNRFRVIEAAVYTAEGRSGYNLDCFRRVLSVL